MPWDSMTKIAPSMPCVASPRLSWFSHTPVNRPSVTNPMWLTEEYATSFFKSGCTSDTSAPEIIAYHERPTMSPRR